ncbi:MAG: hypothetical protein FJX11_21125 [Alphaproteobacteria bacterium]|nr:hypothetical protein [Alphaproteobacteria bacterium]
MTRSTWLLRGLLGVGGAILVFFAWPVANGAWQASKSNSTVYDLRSGKAVPIVDILSAVSEQNAAVADDPTAGRRLARSELLAGLALTRDLPLTPAERRGWLTTAMSDLDFGLGNAPARGAAWARLASVRQAVDGTSAKVVAALLMSIDTAPMVALLWPSRLRLILDNWQFFTAPQRERIGTYVVTTWRLSADKRGFAEAIRSPLDELLVRYFLRDEPGAQQELSQWLARFGKK